MVMPHAYLGSVIIIASPPSVTFSAFIDPPNCSKIFAVIESPSPLPLLGLLLEGSVL